MFVQHTYSQPIQWRAVRLAAKILVIEMAVVFAALALWGLLSARPSHVAAAPEACVHFGRAGGHCPAGAGQGDPDSEGQCDFLGRAGRFCPPVRRNPQGECGFMRCS